MSNSRLETEAQLYFKNFDVNGFESLLLLGKSNLTKFITYFTTEFDGRDKDVKLLEAFQKECLQEIEDKPLLPELRSVKYLDNDVEKIYDVYYYDNENGKQCGTKFETTLNGNKFVYRVGLSNGEKLISPDTFCFLSVKDATYLKSHPKYAKIWLNSIGEDNIPECMKLDLLRASEYNEVK